MIPEAAVEAARLAVYRARWVDAYGPSGVIATDEVIARAALEAATPHLIQAAKAEAWDEGAIDGQWNAEHACQIDAGTRQVIPNPYR